MKTYIIKRDDKLVDEILNKCADKEADGESDFRGMTYEQGVRAGIDWLLGNMDENPLE